MTILVAMCISGRKLSWDVEHVSNVVKHAGQSCHNRHVYLPPQACQRGSGCPDHDDAAVVVHGETPPEEVAAPPVARGKLSGLLPSTVRLSPLPPPGAVETPHFRLLPAVDAAAAVVFFAADRRGGGGREGRASLGRDETGEQVDRSGARGVVFSGDVVGLRRGRSGRGNVGGPGARDWDRGGLTIPPR